MNSRGLLPKHVRRVRAKGKNYYYFNTGMTDKGKVVWKRLPDVRSDDFGGAYASMLGHRSRRSKPGALTIPALIDLYERSVEFRDLAKSSQRNYGTYLKRLGELLPTAPAAEVTRGDMRRLIDKMGETPGAANLFLGTCGALFKWAVGNEYIASSPSQGIKYLKMGEHAPWPQPVLSAALSADDGQVRLLVHLLYYTALRINDALSLTWGSIQDGIITVHPQKGTRRRQTLHIPVHAALAAELARHQKSGVVIAINPNTKRRYGEDAARRLLQDFASGFGVEVVPHGLRKNAVNALLEVGCSVAETAAISGQTLQLVEHYAKERDQSKLARAAVIKWEKNG
jgi:integrase